MSTTSHTVCILFCVNNMPTKCGQFANNFHYLSTFTGEEEDLEGEDDEEDELGAEENDDDDEES